MLGNTSENGQLLFNFTSEKPSKKKKEDTTSAPKTPSVIIRNKDDGGFVKRKNAVANSKKALSPEKNAGKPNNAEEKAGAFFSSIFSCNPVSQPLVINKQEGVSEPLFSGKTFDEMSLHPHLVSCLKSRFIIEKVTTVQLKTIPILLKGQDALVKSCTGSGKTLAYAVPIVHKLQEIRPKIQRSDGVYALIVVPTRELALQCFESFSLLTKAFTWIVPGYLIGGEKKKSEKARIRKGINILISTPGRLIDHLEWTACLSLEKITWFVIDEADRLLEDCFEGNVAKIVSKCNSNRQSVLLSATLSKEVQSLAGISLTNPVHIDISTSDGSESSDFLDVAIPQNLKQFVVLVPPKLRLAVLSGFIVENCLKGNFKAVIFMGSQNSAEFHYEILTDVLGTFLREKGHACKFFKLHGHMKQEDRTAIFSDFKSIKEGVLLSTDVAARGLNLPSVEWIVQYSAPHSTDNYVHRVGRTARMGHEGNSLLFLLPSENRFGNLLAEHKINFEETPYNQYLQSLMLISDKLLFRGKGSAEDCATALQTRYEKAVYEEKILHQMAKDAYASYIHSYTSYPKNVRDVLPFKELHLGHLAKSFCLREAPSQLGISKFQQKQHGKQSEHNRKQNPVTGLRKRTFQGTISEFDSGLSDLHPDLKSKKTKMLPNVSERDSGFSDRKLETKQRVFVGISEFGSGLSAWKSEPRKTSKKKRKQ